MEPGVRAGPFSASERTWSVSSFHGNGETLHPFAFALFQTESRYIAFLKLL